MDLIIKSNDINYIKYIVSPITPYIICQHYFSTEVYKKSRKYVWYDINKIINENTNDLIYQNLFLKKPYNIKEGDIIQVQVDLLRLFIKLVLPNIKCKIVIITSQLFLPQILKNKTTDQLLNNNKILLWISQNPIYKNHKKYMGFPYGIHTDLINNYIDFIKKNYDKILNIKNKTNLIYNSPITIHPHLSKNNIRQHKIFNDVKYKRLPYEKYLNNILKSKFTISLSGDRDDCYRHYECIGLNSIPISDINYEEIFENNMIYSDINEIIKFIKLEKDIKFYQVNRDILLVDYWKNKISKRLKKATLRN